MITGISGKSGSGLDGVTLDGLTLDGDEKLSDFDEKSKYPPLFGAQVICGERGL